MATVDLGAIAETLFESELFGHRKGAFTDAGSDRAGRFQAADGGTLFLDEIGNLPPSLQSKLLHVLESREVIPLGSDHPVPIDVRLVAATNQPLETLVAEGRFREDLLYRINTIEVQLPPLRERLDDVAVLVAHFIPVYARKYRLAEKLPTTDAMSALKKHHWPGNVRELRNLMERVAFLSTGEKIEVEDLAFILSPQQKDEIELGVDVGLSQATSRFQQQYIERAIQRASGNMSEAARMLGLHRSNLYRKMRQIGMNVPDNDDDNPD